MNNEIYTNTGLSTFRRCPKAYKLRFVDGWQPAEKSENLTDGTLWHEIMERLGVQSHEAILHHIENETMIRPQWPQEGRYYKFRAMLQAYLKKHEPINPDQREREFHLPLINPQTGHAATTATMAGKIDGLKFQDGEWWLVEYKTTSRIDIDHITKLDLDYQLHIYKRNAEKLLGFPIAGVIYDIIQKPTIHRGKAESDADFEERRAKLQAASKTGKPSQAKQKVEEPPQAFGTRVLDWYELNSETAFYRERFRLKDVDVETELWTLHKMVRFCHYANHFPRFSESCKNFYGECDYFPYCANGDNSLILQTSFIQGELHPELKSIKEGAMV